MPKTIFDLLNVKGTPPQIDVQEFKSPPAPRDMLPPTLLERARRAFDAMRDVVRPVGSTETCATEFEDALISSDLPESELYEWEAVVETLKTIAGATSGYDRAAVYMQLLYLMCGAVSNQEFTDPSVRVIAERFDKCHRAILEKGRHATVCTNCYRQVVMASAIFCSRCGHTLIHTPHGLHDGHIDRSAPCRLATKDEGRNESSR